MRPPDPSAIVDIFHAQRAPAREVSRPPPPNATGSTLATVPDAPGRSGRLGVGNRMFSDVSGPFPAPCRPRLPGGSDLRAVEGRSDQEPAFIRRRAPNANRAAAPIPARINPEGSGTAARLTPGVLPIPSPLSRRVRLKNAIPAPL
jgi:hypothetical protein